MPKLRVALVGDYNANVVAHKAIEKCFTLVSGFEAVWISTETISAGNEYAFNSFSGIWCVPASPYRNMAGALCAIQYARTQSVPFLGTCGGFQHALVEYARNVLGLANADHAETNPNAALPVVSRLTCSLVEQTKRIVVCGDGFKQIYGSNAGSEGFCCSFGLNPQSEELFKHQPLEIVARSEEGEARAFALRGHPFFVGTLFQPERRALTNSQHPVVMAFFAAISKAGRRGSKQ
jgi:CTP synthase (UTP-ammonia lyase)